MNPPRRLFANDDFQISLPASFLNVPAETKGAPLVFRCDEPSMQLTVRALSFRTAGDRDEIERRGERIEMHQRDAIAKASPGARIGETTSVWTGEVLARRFGGAGPGGLWSMLMLCTPQRVISFFIETPTNDEDAFDSAARTILNSIELRPGRIAS